MAEDQQRKRSLPLTVLFASYLWLKLLAVVSSDFLKRHNRSKIPVSVPKFEALAPITFGKS